MHVILYDNEELEDKAVLEFDPEYDSWMARPLRDTLRRFEIREEPPAAAQ